MLQEELKTRLSLIEENIKKVNQEVQQGMANLNLLNGGKQECLYWMNQLDSPEVVQIQNEVISIDPIDGSKEKRTF